MIASAWDGRECFVFTHRLPSCISTSVVIFPPPLKFTTSKCAQFVFTQFPKPARFLRAPV